MHAHPLIAGMPTGVEPVNEWDPRAGAIKAWRYADVGRVWREVQEAFNLRPGYSVVKEYERGAVDGYVAKYVFKDQVDGDLWNLYGFTEEERGSRLE